MPEPSPKAIDAFILKWSASSGHERGSGQYFLLDFCDLLGLEKPAAPVFGIEYWMEQGLVVVWPNLVEGDRVRVFELLRNLLAIEESEDDTKHFLARLPLADHLTTFGRCGRQATTHRAEYAAEAIESLA